jgi:hypothetical protein
MYFTISFKKEFFVKNKEFLIKQFGKKFKHVNTREIPELPGQVLIDGYGKKEDYMEMFNYFRYKKNTLACPIVGIPDVEYGELMFWKGFSPEMTEEDYEKIEDTNNHVTLCIPKNFLNFKRLMNWYEINHDKCLST